MTTSDPRSDFLSFRRSGDPAALARVFDALAPKLLLLAAHLARREGCAEDLVQATFVQVMHDADRYDETRPLTAWLAGIVAHRAADERRRARLRERASADSEPALAGDELSALAEREALERISAAIDGLEEPYREVLVLRTAHGLTPAEIAHALGRPPGTVRMQLQRARERLKERLPRELALPALFLRDEGRGLAAVRADLLDQAVRSSAPQAAPLASALAARSALSSSVLVLSGVLAVVTGVLVYPRSGERSPDVRSAELAGAEVAAMEPSLELSTPPTVREVQSAREDRPLPAPSVLPESRVPNVIGRVVALDGTPVPFARVFSLDEESPGLQRDLATTGADGAFVAYEVAVDTWLGARSPGHQPTSFNPKRGAVRVRIGRNVGVELRLGATGHRLSGTLVDASAAPLGSGLLAVAVDEDARLSLAGLPERRANQGKLDRETFVLEVDEQGRFWTDEAPAGEALLIARAPAGLVALRLIEVRAEQENGCELALEPGARLVGRVLDESGRGVAGVELRGEWKGSDEFGELEDELGERVAGVRTRSGPDGSYELAGLIPGETEVQVRMGLKILATERFEFRGREEQSWNAAVRAQGALDVRALGPDGAPLAGWGLAWRTGDDDRDRELGREPRMPVVLDEAGRYRIEAMDLCAHVLAVFPPPDVRARYSGLACAERSGVVSGPEELVVRLRPDEMPSSALTGGWLDSQGRPLAGATVWLEAEGEDGEYVATAALGEDGRFHFEHLPAGQLVLLGSARERYPARTVLANVALAGGEQRELGSVRLPDPVKLVIELTAEDGMAITDPRLELIDGSRSSTLRLDADTNLFRSPWIWPGEYELLVRGGDIPPLRQRIQVETDAETFQRVVCPRREPEEREGER